MRDEATIPEATLGEGPGGLEGGEGVPALLVAWSAHEPERVGEVMLLGGAGPVTWELGRGAVDPAPGRRRAVLLQQRPSRNRRCPPLANPRISRVQLLVHVGADGSVVLERQGRLPLRHRGGEVDRVPWREGAVYALGRQLLLLAVRRPLSLPPLRARDDGALHPFGEADEDGIVGETPAMWALRDRLAFVAAVGGHVLITGESGTGKELVARAIHARSARGRRPLVARSAATIPESLVEAEMFGNRANYPNPGMAERPGLVGRAHGSTLFLDEIGELPEALQARLLRLLDAGGEYHRLGEARARHADLRLVGATNRPPESLKPDLVARLKLRVAVPPLRERLGDVPILARHLLRRAAGNDALVRERFFERGDPGRPRLAPELVEALLGHAFPTNVRELDGLLWRAMASSTGDALELTDEVREALAPQRPAAAPGGPAGDGTVDPATLDPAHVQAVLDDNGGVIEKTWRALGLRNRFQLIRYIKKHGLVTRRR